jgi:hypothetical protein
MSHKLLEFTESGIQILISAETDAQDIVPTMNLDDAITKVTGSLEKFM